MKNNLKKYVMIGVMSLVAVALVFLGIYCYKQNKKIKVNSVDEVKAEVVVKAEVTAEIMSDVFKVEDFFDNKKTENDLEINYKKDGEDVTFLEKYDKLGTYEVVIKNKDKEYKSLLNVVDTTKPVLKLKSVSIKVNDKYNISDFIESCVDNSGEECILSYKEDKLYKDLGVYDIVIIAKDSSGNETEETTKLEILEKQTSNKTNTETKNNTKNNNSNDNKTKNNKVKFVKEETEKEKAEKDLKYGSKLTSWHVKTYNVYSDGSKKLIDEYNHSEVDAKNFNAKTSDMLPEAIENMNIYSNMVNDVLKYTNEFRAEVNKSPLVLDETLTKAAMVRAVEMAYANKFSHERPDGNMCYYIMRDFGQDIYGVGENIAMGQRNAKEVSYAWKGSQGHYENMIDSSFTRIGVGVIKFQGTYYWVQLFQY